MRRTRNLKMSKFFYHPFIIPLTNLCAVANSDFYRAFFFFLLHRFFIQSQALPTDILKNQYVNGVGLSMLISCTLKMCLLMPVPYFSLQKCATQQLFHIFNRVFFLTFRRVQQNICVSIGTWKVGKRIKNDPFPQLELGFTSITESFSKQNFQC